MTRRMRVKVTVTSRYGFTVDVPDEVSTRDVRKWFQDQDSVDVLAALGLFPILPRPFDPRDRDIEEKVIDEKVTVSPTERDAEDPTFCFDGKELT